MPSFVKRCAADFEKEIEIEMGNLRQQGNKMGQKMLFEISCNFCKMSEMDR